MSGRTGRFGRGIARRATKTSGTTVESGQRREQQRREEQRREESDTD
jgi:hypothetical protein